MKRSLLVLAFELSAKAARSGLASVGALVDCGMPVRRDGAEWLAVQEEERDVWDAPLSADFDDDFGPCECVCAICISGDHCDTASCATVGEWEPPMDALLHPFGVRPLGCELCGANCNDACAPYELGPSPQSPAAMQGAVEDPPAEVPPASAGADSARSGVLHGVPTFAAMQDILEDYLYDHSTPDWRLAEKACGCGLEVINEAQWVEHVTELQASAMSFVIQEARHQK